MHWSERWIGLPYREEGRGPDAYDCLGLMLAVQEAEFGRRLGYGVVPLGAAESAALGAHIGEWARTERARAGDVVLMRRGRGWHVGVALDDAFMLHAERPLSVVERFRAGKWGERFEGVYRHAG